MHYLYLTLAIVLEVLATALLGKSEGFTKWLFAVGSLLSYGVCFYFLSLALKNIPLGVAYAIWSGVGIVLTAIVGILVFKSKIDLPFILGALLIIAGVVVINLFSKANGYWNSVINNSAVVTTDLAHSPLFIFHFSIYF